MKGLEESELLAGVSFDLVGLDLQDVEVDGFAEGSALSDGHDISFLDTEAGRAVNGDVLVSLFVSLVLLDEGEVVSADDDSSLHLGGDDHALQDLSSDGHVSGEGALLVDVLALNGLGGGAEAKTGVFVVARSALGALRVQENSRLFLECVLVLVVSHRAVLYNFPIFRN